MAKRTKFIRTSESERLSGHLAKIARSISGQWGVQVIFTGTRCSTNGSVIYLPYNADHLSEGGKRLVHGNLDHETAHVTEEVVSKAAGRPGAIALLRAEPIGAVKMLFNAFEDIRIEAKYAKMYPGVAENLRHINQHAIEAFHARHGEAGVKNFWHLFGCAIIGTAHGFDTSWCPASVLAWLPLAEAELAAVAKAEGPEDTLECARSLHAKVVSMAKDLKEKAREEAAADEDSDEGEEGSDDGSSKFAISDDDDEPSEPSEGEEKASESEVVHMDLREKPPTAPKTKPADEDDDEGEASSAPGGTSEPDDSDDEVEGPSSGAGDEGDDEGEEDSEDNSEGGGGSSGGDDTEGDDEGEEGASGGGGGSDDSDDEGDEDGASSGGDEDGEEGPAAGGEGDSDEDGDGGDEGADGGAPPEEAAKREGHEAHSGEPEAGSDGEPDDSIGYLDGVDLGEYDPTAADADETDIASEAKEAIEAEATADVRDHHRYIPQPECLARDRWITPESTEAGVAEYTRGKEIVREQIGAMRHKLLSVVRVRSASRTVSDQESGALDAASLHMLRQGERRVFANVVQGETLDTAVELVLDFSGSMGPRERGFKSYYSWLMTIALCETFEALKAPFEVFGFHNNARRVPAFEYNETYVQREPFDFVLLKGWDEKLRTARGRFNAIQGYHDNADGEAVRIGARRLAQRPEKRKIMCVLSDGMPECARCDSAALNADLQDAVRSATKAGLEVFGIGCNTKSVERFYNKSTGATSIVVNDINTLATQVYSAMRMKLLKGKAA